MPLRGVLTNRNLFNWLCIGKPPAPITADEGDLEGFRMAMLRMFEIRGTVRQESGWIQPAPVQPMGSTSRNRIFQLSDMLGALNNLALMGAAPVAKNPPVLPDEQFPNSPFHG